MNKPIRIVNAADAKIQASLKEMQRADSEFNRKRGELLAQRAGLKVDILRMLKR